MTVASTTNRVSYTGNGSTTVFAFGHPYRASSDLVVTVRTVSTGAESLKQETVDYTVSGTPTSDAGGFASGSVTFLVAPASGTQVHIDRVVTRTQAVDFVSGDSLPPSSIEGSLDKLTQITQELDSRFDRTLLQPRTAANRNLVMPEPNAGNASYFLRVNASGDALVWNEGAVSNGDKGDITVTGTGNTWTIDDDAITTQKIQNNAVITAKIADGNVNTAKLADGAVTTGKLDNGAVTSAKIADNTIVDADINSAAAIAHTKLASITGGRVLMGNSSDIPTATVIGGDATLAATGDLTIAASAVTTSKINNNAVTNAKLDDMAANRIKGTISSGDPSDLTGTQVTTLLDVFTSTLKGLVPLSGGGTANFLRADGSWAPTPAVPDGTYTDITVSSSGAVWNINANAVGTNEIADSAVTSAKIADNTIVNADINATAAIAYSKLAAAASGQLLVGDTGGTLVARTISGDVSINDTGVTAIGANVIVDADISATAAIANSKLATMAANTIKGNATGGSATPTDLSASSARTVLGLGTMATQDASNVAITGGTISGITDLAVADGGTGASTFSAGVVKSSGGTNALTASAITDTDIGAAAAITHSKLASITSGQILLGNASNVPTATAVSGDISINHTGVTAIQSGVIVNDDVNATAAIAPTKLAFTQTGTGASARTVDAKLKEVVSVSDFGAVGDGTTNDTTAFSNAVATGLPVFVPKTSSFYALTSLTAAQQKMLFGPGVVKVSGTQVLIPSESFVNNDIGQVRAVNQDCQPSKWPGVDGSLFNSGFVAQIKRTGGWPSYGGCYFGEYLVSASITTNEYEFGLSCFTTSQNLTGGGIFGGWLSSNTPASSTFSGGALSHTFSSGRCTGLEINSGNRWAEFGLLNDIGNTREVTGLKVVPDVGPSPDFNPNYAGSTPIYHGTFGVCIAGSIWGHKWQTGLLVSENAVAPSGRIMNIIGGSSVGNAAAVLLRATGHINAGIDVSGTTMTGNAFVAGSCDNALYSAGTMSRGIDFGSATITNAAIRIGNASAAVAGTGALTNGVSFANATSMSGSAFIAGSCGSALLSAGTMTRGIDFSGATISGQGILFNNDQNVQWVGGAQFSGTSSGSFGLSTATTSGVGTLYANGYAVQNLRWGISGGAATIGFLGATAIVRPASANQAALTNSTGGTRDGTLADVGATYNQATLNNNFTDLHVLVDEIRTALVNLGLMKGSA